MCQAELQDYGALQIIKPYSSTSVMGCDVTYFYWRSPAFRRNVLPPSSEPKNKRPKKPARSTCQAELQDYGALQTIKPYSSTSVMGCDVTYFYWRSPVFRRNLLPPFSGPKINQTRLYDHLCWDACRSFIGLHLKCSLFLRDLDEDLIICLTYRDRRWNP
jgi:hypothetical protein